MWLQVQLQKWIQLLTYTNIFYLLSYHCHINKRCFVSDLYVGSFSRSAVNYMAGCKTAVSNIVMSIVVLLTLLLITPLFKYTPNAVLASIIIAAVLGLVNIEAVILLWKIDKFDFLACMGAFFGVIFISVEIGLLIAVMRKQREKISVIFAYSIWPYLLNLLCAGGYIFCQNPLTSDKAKNCSTRKTSRDYCL